MIFNKSNNNDYSSPDMLVEEFVIERGFIDSTEYGYAGEAGEDIDNNNYGGF